MEKKPHFTGPRKPAAPGGSRPRPGQKFQRGERNPRDPYATNEQIRAREVRLVGDNVEQGVYPIEKARRIAADLELDLIEISPTADPPVCRVLDYQKFLYQQKKRQKEQKQKAAKVEQTPVLEGKRMIIMLSPLKAAPKKEKGGKGQDAGADTPDQSKSSEEESAD